MIDKLAIAQRNSSLAIGLRRDLLMGFEGDIALVTIRWDRLTWTVAIHTIPQDQFPGSVTQSTN